MNIALFIIGLILIPIVWILIILLKSMLMAYLLMKQKISFSYYIRKMKSFLRRWMPSTRTDYDYIKQTLREITNNIDDATSNNYSDIFDDVYDLN